MFDMSYDSHLFRTNIQLRAAGASESERAEFVLGDNQCFRLYESKLIHQFDHRYATYNAGEQEDECDDVPSEHKADPEFCITPRYWVGDQDYSQKMNSTGWMNDWIVAFRMITNTTNERTSISAIVPKCGVGNSSYTLTFENISAADICCFVANANSFCFDWLTRQKLAGSNLNVFILKQLPTLPPTCYAKACPWVSPDLAIRDWIVPRALEMTYTAWDLRSFAKDCDFDGPPLVWNDDRRVQIRCELDAAFFHLYGIARDDVDYIMDTFPIVKRKDEQNSNGDYRTKRVILEIYDAMAEATKTGQGYQSRLDPPPADPRVAHPAKASTAAQVQRGRVVAYLTLLLHAWKKPVTRDALEPSLIFMLNDKLRSAALGKQFAVHVSARTASGEIVKGLDGLLAALHANRAMVVENVHGRQTIRLGANAAAIDSAPQADRQRAEEAVKATGVLGEDRAMTYLDGIGEARYDVVRA